ncbi:MAG: DEAD/DEAH box helicase [Candidatus Bathyarchaeota archaeon]|uniref:DEAD/DEAH box helicase n=1 Tax=Candidatus Bathycorpusculum sp. TaxID=2994959 RepID=UPI002821EE85|nr:DEAD/DEAH box helicase [Candidatus Termiticorpusculum sp.]MCL2257480.1 DEAD/DEAH box helicase [Candidatus Termiticorpusculum sp.]MCL2292392.1 DEAD/DEAH box helicase [Candidatus Termiticorpusculum sp.]
MDNKRLIVIFEDKGFILDFEGRGEVLDKELRLYKSFLKETYKTLFFFGFKPVEDLTDGLRFLHAISEKMISKISLQSDIEFTRENTDFIFSTDELEHLLLSTPFVTGIEHVTSKWLVEIFSELAVVFRGFIKGYEGTVQRFLTEQKSNLTVMGRVFFHLVESKQEEMPFAFLATYSTKSETGKVNHVPLKQALLEYKDQTAKLLELLSTVSQAVQRSVLISQLAESGELFSPLRFSSEEAYTFLKEIPLYEESGIICRIPDWWKKKQSQIGVKVTVGEKGKSTVGARAILSFNSQIALGDETLTLQEINFLLAQSDGLIFLKGRWVEVDHNKLQRAIDIIEKAQAYAGGDSLDIFEALRLEMQPTKLLGLPDDGLVSVEISNGQWLSSALEKIRKPEKIQTVSAGDAFRAVLRHYQQLGLNWLSLMIEMGFGACLADDMGLGKTVQVIGLLEYLRISREQKKPSLLVIPASLIGNWQAELEKFAPDLKYKVLHDKKTLNVEIDNKHQLYITTYTMLSKRVDVLNADWTLFIIDEAQAIKNPSTKQTKAVKRIKAFSKIALTGTPIENRLTDLWSLFDFLNAGLLGNMREFKDFVKRLNEHENDYGKLRLVVSPFILRRLKTDKSVISDLPNKIEMKNYTQLSKKQIVLYKDFVDALEEKLKNVETDGMERKGLILSSILRLKQICNHPDHYLGQTEYNEKYSGKFLQLRNICETIYEKRERVLIFTQFKEIIEPLDDFLEPIFERRGLVLHGGTPIKKRQTLVEKFCGKEYVPYMILSLKAGGVGLNLAKANHVIHFDRWWNPAVENQATDRAFRIGQEKNVLVHKFIAANTIEEKIDQMIEDKTKLSGDIIEASGENWITELSNNELMKIFRMTGEN